MRRHLITSLLALLIANAGAGIATAQDAGTFAPSASSYSSSASGSSSSSAAATPFKLFAGVSHQELLPQAHESIEPHVQKQKVAIAPALEVQKPVLKPERTMTAPPIAFLPKLSETVVKPVARPPVLTAQTAVKQSYEPAFGVARLTAERSPDPPRPAQHYTIEWFMIPSWMAGVWLKSGDMTTNVTDLRTGATSSQNEWTDNRMEASWGHLQDARGNYWHVNLLPSERDGMSAGKLVRFLTVAQKCEGSSPQKLMTRTHYIVSESNPWSNQPLDTFQQESINQYEMSGQNEILNSSSNRVFTYQGAPVREGHLISKFNKIRGFTPVATLNGVDLRTSLNDYLKGHSLGYLVK
jgi:hypothetical protein